MAKRVDMELLFERLQSLSDDYMVDHHNEDIFILQDGEVPLFIESLEKALKYFIQSEVQEEDPVGADMDELDEDEDEIYFDEWFDDDLD